MCVILSYAGRLGGIVTLIGCIIGMSATAGHAQTVFVWDAGGDGVTWTDPDNWFNATFNDYPRFNGDTALVTGTGAVGTGSPPVLTENITLGDLEIVSGGDVFNGVFGFFAFNVADRTLIGGAGSSLRLSNSPSAAELVTNTLEINDTGSTDAGLILSGATAQANAGVTVNAGGTISGNGVLQLNSTTGNIVNDGTIQVTGTDTLLIDGSGSNTGRFDWDGLAGSTARLVVRDNARLDINLDQGADAFGGEILLANRGEMDNAVPWTLDTLGLLQFSGSSFTGEQGRVRGGQVTSRGTIEAISGSGDIASNLQMVDGAMTIGSSTGAAREIRVFAGKVFPAADLNFIKGTFRTDNVTNALFTIDQTGKLFDWDGPNNDFRTFVARGSRLTVDATQINPNTGAFTTNRFAGELWVEGVLTVNGIGPDLLIEKVNPTDPAMFRLRGDFNTTYQGVPLVFGGSSTFIAEPDFGSNRVGTFNAPVRFDGGNIQAAPGMTVIFAQHLEFRGGSAGYTGTGGIRFQSTVNVNTLSTLNLPFATTFDATSSTTLINNATMNLNGPVTFAGGGITGNDAAIGLFNDAVVTGGTTTIFVRDFNLDGAGSNTITIDTGATLDLTGRDTDGFDGTLNVSGTFDYSNRFVSTGWTNAGTLNLTNGTILGSRMNHAGLMVSSGNSRLAPSSLFLMNGSTTTINGGTLTLDAVGTSIEDTAVFAGNGTLVNDSVAGIGDTDLNGVSLENRGALGLVGEPFDPAFYRTVLTKAHAFQQNSTGELAALLAGGSGNPGTDFSHLEISTTAKLNGRLTVDMLGGFTPSLGDGFHLITAGGGITGTFDGFNYPVLSPGLAWQLVYSANDFFLIIVTAIPGDLNGDGFVGIDDLNLVLANWNLNVPPADPRADPSGDSFVGIDDLNAVLGNWNTGLPPVSTVSLPEPGTAWLIGVFGLASNRRVRRGVSLAGSGLRQIRV